MSDLLYQIKNHYNTMTPSAKKIADYLQEHHSNAQYLSISGLAKECGVAEATIFRFCKSLGFGGYNEFKLALARSSITTHPNAYSAYGKLHASDSMKDMCQRLFNSNLQALRQTLELVDEVQLGLAGDLLTAANRVFCVGFGGSMIAAYEAWGRFLTVSPKFFTVVDGHMQIMTASLLGPEDVVLFVSYSGSTTDAADLLRPAKARGAKVILITHYADSLAASMADVVLLCGGHEGPLQSGSISAKMAMLFVVDLLVNEFCRRDLETAMHNKDITSNALSCRHL